MVNFVWKLQELEIGAKFLPNSFAECNAFSEGSSKPKKDIDVRQNNLHAGGSPCSLISRLYETHQYDVGPNTLIVTRSL